MRLEEIWWKRLTNPLNFAEDIIYSVLDGKTVFVLYEKEFCGCYWLIVFHVVIAMALEYLICREIVLIRLQI